MKKYFLFITMVFIMASVVTSCGNKNDRAINEYEKLIKKANATTDPIKKIEIVEEAYEVANDIKQEELTAEQKERLLKINLDVFKHATDGLKSIKGGRGFTEDSE